MKSLPCLLAAVVLAPSARAVIALDAANSSWAGSNLVTFQGASNGTSLYMGNQLGPDFDPSYMGALATFQQGTQFVAAMQATTYPGGSLSLQTELAGSNLAAGTQVQLAFNGLASAPSYVGLIGGSVASYAYANGTLTISATTGALASTANNLGAGRITQAFAVIIETDPSFNFGGALFRTNSSWNDLGNLNPGYDGQAPLVGLNVNGLNGSNVVFDAYFTVGYLASIGINSPADARAFVQKSDTSFEIDVLTTLYTAGGVDPELVGVYDVFGGSSSFMNLDGGVLDDVIKATYANGSWSAGNIGLIAVPEPSTYGLALGGLVLVAAALRRRRKT